MTARERAILIRLEITRRPARKTPASLEGGDYTPEESLEELQALAESAGAEVVDRVLQMRPAPDAATFIGSGKLEQLRRLTQSTGADLVIFDQELTPTQLRNIENAAGCKVLDRTQLILDIFARRARTREGQLQVELAQLNYLLPRLVGRGVQMSRLGGGIGARGPGETQLETDRRRIYRRIRKLKEELEAVRASRSTQRRLRQAAPMATIALVGYTNAGKSTLFNRLTGAGVLADDRMFATLDPTVRAIVLPSRRRALLSDTVGFIRNLPTTLIQAFRATLEEVVEASLLLHVVDASSPHAPQQTTQVSKVLAEIGAGSTPQVLVLNKADRLPEEEAGAACRRILGEASEQSPARAVAVSALHGYGLDRLLELVDEILPADPIRRVRIALPASDGASRHLLHEHARVISERFEEDRCEMEVDMPDSLARRFAEYTVRD